MYSTLLATLSLLLPFPGATSQAAGLATTQPRAVDWIEQEGLTVAVVPRSLEDQAWFSTEGRTNAPTRDEKLAWQRFSTEATVKHLREMGVNLIVLPYGGYGPDNDEKEARERAIQFSRVCHGADLRVGLSLPVGSLRMGEWKDADPAAAESLTRSIDGETYSADPFGRVFTSRISLWDSRRTRALIDEAVRRADPEVLLLPDFLMAANAEPAAIAAFEAYLKRARRHFKDDPQHLEMRRSFRIRALADALKSAATEAREQKTDVQVAISGNVLEPRVAEPDGAAVDPTLLLPQVDLVFDDSQVVVPASGRVTHQVTAYKGSPPVVPTPRTAIDAAQSLAFNHGIIGSVLFLIGEQAYGDERGLLPPSDEILGLARFAREHRELYAGQQSYADVVVLRSRVSALHGSEDARLVSLQTEQTLVSHHIPFALSSVAIKPNVIRPRAEQATPDSRALVIAGAERMSNEDIRGVRSSLSSGVGLVVVGPCGTRDNFGKPRDRDLAQSLVGPQASSQTAEKGGFRQFTLPGSGARVAVVATPGPIREAWTSVGQGRKPPQSGREEETDFERAIRWVLGRPLSVEAALPSSMAIELTASETADRMVLHRVQFDPRNKAPAAEVRVALPHGRRMTRVRRCDPTGMDTDFDAVQRGDVVSFRADSFALYDAYLIETVDAASEPAAKTPSGR